MVEVSFETNKEEAVDESQEIVKEEENSAEDELEEKRQVFVDTSGEVTDETPQAETEKIGETGSVAKDLYATKDNINDEPRLTDDSDVIVIEPEYKTALKPMQADVQVEPQVNIQPAVKEEMVNGVPDGETPEKIEESNESEVSEEIREKTVAQETTEVAVDDTVSQVEEGDMKVSSFDSDVIVPEPMPAAEVSEEAVKPAGELKDDDKKEEEQQEPEERVPDPDKEHIKLASIPKNIMNQIVEAPREEIEKSIQESTASTEPQAQTIVPSDDVQAPFFEDNISNAPVQGQESFNVKKHEYAPYYKHIRDKIRLFWLVQYGTDASINLVTKDYKPIIVEFKVLPSGKIVNVIISNTAGNDLLASKVQTSVQNTLLNKFPEYVNDEFINVRFNFYFF